MNKVLSTLIVLLLSVVTASAHEPFRFAVVTDIHIHAGQASPTEDLRSTVSQINADPDIDFVLVTGDIADAGDSVSLVEAKRELDKLNKRYYIIQGNHDQNWSESGCMDFRHVFGYERFAFSHKGISFVGFPTGPMLRMALGHVNPEDIEWLETQLDESSLRHEPTVIVCHIPMQPQDVDNWYKVTSLARKYNAVAFIDGHYHRNINLTCDGVPSIVNITNLRQKGNATGQYNEIDITADSIIVYTHPIGSQRQQWMSLPIRSDYNGTNVKKFPMPDYSVNAQYPNVNELWTVSQRSCIFSSPVAYNNNVYAADNQGKLVCYDTKGKEKWTFRAGARIVGTPAAGNGTIVLGSADNNIYGIDAKSGKMRWKVATGRPCVSAVTIDRGIAYIGASDGVFRAINVKDGTLRWQASGIKGYVETKPLVADKKVIFGDWANTLYCLDAATGRQLWTWQPPNKTNMHFSPAGVWPVAAKGKVFICDPERAMTAIDLQTGRQLWRTYQSKVRESIGISNDGKRVYAKTMQDSIVCYSTETDHPQELWATNCGFGYEHARVMLTEHDGTCYATNKNGLIIALDGKTGRQLWQHKVSNTYVNTVVPLPHGKIAFTDADGTVGVIKARRG